MRLHGRHAQVELACDLGVAEPTAPGERHVVLPLLPFVAGLWRMLCAEVK